MSRTIQIEDGLTVGSLAEKLDIPVSKLIAELMKNGVLATVNERIDYDTAEIITGELDPDIKLEKKAVEPEAISRKRDKK
ncbi:MAG: translation initiation factor IF-2 N-terminal domain-containing protein, partial [Candidatus Paceibacterota bacterium]